MNTVKTLKQAAIVAGFTFALSACDQGPAEEAGEKIDEVAEDVGNSVEDACENMKEELKAKDPDC